ncbi:MAG: hypothetical protein ACAI43_20560 [Phycisphaerae bacterium]|nr:hypothetical protein [Tepidisphaeraceae bacterium]
MGNRKWADELWETPLPLDKLAAVHVKIVKSDARAREKPCLRCGYSLRKIESTHCPECGLSVWLSLNNNDNLDRSNPDWLRRVALGLLVMAAAALAGLLAHGLAAKHRLDEATYHARVRQIMENMGEDDYPNPQTLAFLRSPPRKTTTMLWYELGAGVGFLVAYYAGLLLLTSPEGRHPDYFKPARLLTWVGGGAAVLFTAAAVSAVFSPVARDASPTVGGLIGVVAGMIAWRALRRLAKRVPNMALARLYGWLTLVPLVSLLTILPFLIRAIAFEVGVVVDGLVALYFPVAGVLFVRFAVVLRRQAREADKAWASETAAPGAVTVHQAPPKWHE